MGEGDPFLSFTVLELATRWRVSIHTVYRAIKSGALPAYSAGFGNQRPRYRVLLEHVEAWEQARGWPANE